MIGNPRGAAAGGPPGGGWFPLRMTAAHAINPWDTQLG